MRKLLLTMLSILFGFASGNAQNQNFRTLDVSDFETAIANDDIVRLDVRTAEEYAEGHISGAINIDVLKDDFLKRASELPKDKDIALYCRSGNRSKKAAKMLSDNGYRVIELGNGYNGWVKAGKAVTKEEVDLFITESGTTIYVYCIKHGTFKMRVGDKWVYIDPVSDNIPPATDFSSQPKADIILITHEHHDHLDDKAIKDDKTFSDIGELWLSGDHYKWRVMRLCGVSEDYITGYKSINAKFYKLAEIMPNLCGNPVYAWAHMELKRIFGIEKPLNSDTAK